MAIEIEMIDDGRLSEIASRLGNSEMGRAITQAARRAALAARTAGTKQVHSVYTIKSSDLKSHISINSLSDGAVIDFRGGSEKVEKYKAKANQRGVFVTIKRGNTTKVPRGFSLRGQFVARVGRERLPLKSLYGPSVPQLYGNPEVLEIMEERGNEVFETRLEHEIERRLNG